MARRKPKSQSRKSGCSTKNTTGKTNSTKSSQVEQKESTKGSDELKETKETDDLSKGTNDPAWYAKDPQLLIDAGSIPFSDPFGSEIKHFTGEIAVDGVPTIPDATIGDAQAGVLSIRVKPSFGFGKTMNDPLNVAAHMLYTNVRYMNSGRKNYDQADLMMYVGAVADMYSFIYWAKRIYACAFIASQRNKYVGQLLNVQVGTNAHEYVENLAQFRAWLNMFIAKVSTLVIPDNIEMFKRRAFIYSSIYTESEIGNIKDQLYMFNPRAFFSFELDSKGKGCLVPNPVGNNLPYNDFVRIGNKMLENVIGDEDFGIMSGDLMRAFQGNLIGLTSQEAEGTIAPIYDPYVLHQIKNATILNGIVISKNTILESGGARTLSAKDATDNMVYTIPLSLTDPSQTQVVPFGGLYQDGYGNLRYEERAIVTSTTDGIAKSVDYIANASSKRNVIISVDTPVVDPALIVEATRLITIVDKNQSTSSGNVRFATVTPNAEVVCDVELYLFRSDYPNPLKWRQEMRTTNYSKLIDGARSEYAEARYAPLLHILNDDGTTVKEIACVSDLLNYTVQSQDVVKRLNDVSMLSLLSVPGVSKLLN